MEGALGTNWENGSWAADPCEFPGAIMLLRLGKRALLEVFSVTGDVCDWLLDDFRPERCVCLRMMWGTRVQSRTG